MASAAEAAINPYSPLSLASPATDQEAMRLLTSAPVVDARCVGCGAGGGQCIVGPVRPIHVCLRTPQIARTNTREWVESGGGPVGQAKEFRVHRQLPSGRLSACTLVLAPDGRMLLGVEVPGQLGGCVGGWMQQMCGVHYV